MFFAVARSYCPVNPNPTGRRAVGCRQFRAAAEPRTAGESHIGYPFFEMPILDSPYDYPTRIWELDSEGQPTQQIVRIPELVTVD